MLSGISETFAFSTSITDKVESKRTPGVAEAIAELAINFFCIYLAILMVAMAAYIVASIVCGAVVIILLAELYLYSPTACFFVAGALAVGMVFSCAMDQCMRD